MGTNLRSKTWLCKKKVGSTITTVFAKVTTTPYPSKLHEEAGKAGVVPQLSQDEGRFPGDQYLVEMEYLDPQLGWVSLADFDGDWASARSMLKELLRKWQGCCDKQAVHGDLRAPNIFLRWAVQIFLNSLVSMFHLRAQSCTLQLGIRLAKPIRWSSASQVSRIRSIWSSERQCHFPFLVSS